MLTGVGNNPPRAFNSTGASVGAITFDAAVGTLQGETTSGGGY